MSDSDDYTGSEGDSEVSVWRDLTKGASEL